MATDPWYVRELVSDVPPEEWNAAVQDEDFDMDCGEEGDETEDDAESEEEDEDYSESTNGNESDSTDEGSGDLAESGVYSSDSVSMSGHSDDGAVSPTKPRSKDPASDASKAEESEA